MFQSASQYFLMIPTTRGTHWYKQLCYSMYGCGDTHHFIYQLSLLLLYCSCCQADEEMKKERQELTTHSNKATMQQELVHKVCLPAIINFSVCLLLSFLVMIVSSDVMCVCVQINQRQALGAMEEEQARRVKELSALSGDEIERRVAVSDKLLSVQKELLASRKPTKVLTPPHSHSSTHFH